MPSSFDTQQLHAGHTLDPGSKSRAVPIHATTSYVFDSSQHVADLFSFKAEGFVYSRLNNPTVDVFEKRMATLEGGIAAIAVSSGQAAQYLAFCGVAKNGDNIVSAPYLYGGTYNQLKVTFKRFGIIGKFAKDDKPESLEALIDENTKAIFLESISNPKYIVPDLQAVADVAHKHGIPLIVDNTFGAGGYLVKPIAHGADIVVHSATKWIGGHGTTMGGVIIDSGKFDWEGNGAKFPHLTEPSEAYHGMQYTKTVGNALSFISYVRLEMLRDIGPCMNPMAAFQLIQGVETLSLRADRHVENSLKLAKWLESNSYVNWVLYPGLESHPSHETAKKYLKRGFGGVLSFGVKIKSENSSAEVVDNLKLASHLANVGDMKTLVIAPYHTTHNQLSHEERISVGVTEDLIRVSVGCEFIDDIIADFETAFKKVYETEPEAAETVTAQVV